VRLFLASCGERALKGCMQSSLSATILRCKRKLSYPVRHSVRTKYYSRQTDDGGMQGAEKQAWPRFPFVERAPRVLTILQAGLLQSLEPPARLARARAQQGLNTAGSPT
jgi:hypothetical protein